MREIKFRAFDKARKEMFFLPVIDGENKNWLQIDSIGINVGTKNGFLSENEFELMQFTGLQDKNEVDIYDGDILKVKMKHGFNSELLQEFKELKNLESINGINNHFIGIVRIDFLRGLMFENPKNGYKEPMFSRHIELKRNHSEIEVIGNIYENPELL